VILEHDGWFGPGWGLLAGLAWTVFWVVVVLIVVSAIRRRPGGRPPGSSAVRLLEERYARGEISRDEFLERRAVLLGEPPAG
jgi:putative membrane protein